MTEPNSDPSAGGLSRRATLKTAAAAVAGGAVASALAAQPAVAAGGGPFIVVDASGGGDYTDLETAVASAPADSHIYVKAGLYTIQNGRMSPAPGVLLAGAGYGTHIVARNGLNTSIFTIDQNNVALENL